MLSNNNITIFPHFVVLFHQIIPTLCSVISSNYSHTLWCGFIKLIPHFVVWFHQIIPTLCSVVSSNYSHTLYLLGYLELFRSPFKRAAACATGVRCLCSRLSGHRCFIPTKVQALHSVQCQCHYLQQQLQQL